jgi:bacillithiol biosynthesis deacetylase BshB1
MTQTDFIISPERIYQRADDAANYPANAPVDALVIAAHPDDAELSCGGAIAQMTSEGKRVAIVECTRGEMGSRGTADIRRAEALEAAQILGLVERWNLHLPDGNITITPETTAQIIAAIRYFRPNILLFPPAFERHLDHENVHRLVRTAVFQSGLTKITVNTFGTSLAPHRPKRLLCYMQTYEFEPNVYVDVSAHFEAKLQSIFAHASQVFVPGAEDYGNAPKTLISSPEFLEFLKARARHFGGRIGVEYAEGFQTLEPLGFAAMSALLR